MASSIYGAARSTLDVDLVADLESHHVGSLVSALESAYHVDAEMIDDAIVRKSSFNLIHLLTMLKVDVFITPDTPYARQAFERTRTDTLDDESSREFAVASPEDVILNKLDWYRKGEEISDRQWMDVVGVLRVMGRDLDMAYLQRWAAELDLADLLRRAIDESEGRGS